MENTPLPPCETSHKTIKDPQNDKKKIVNFRTSKLCQSKNLQNSQEEKQMSPLPPCETSHKKIEDPQNDKNKIDIF
jgi:hypothetical protein